MSHIEESLVIAKQQRKRARPSKWGRDKIGCQRYREQGRREKNKLRKLKKILKLQPHNKQIYNLLNGTTAR